MNRRFKQLGIIGLTCTMLLSLTACNEPSAAIVTNIETALELRVSQNKDICNKLLAFGLITPEENKRINGVMDTTVDNVKTEVKAGKAGIFTNAITDWCLGRKKTPESTEKLEEIYFTNYYKGESGTLAAQTVGNYITPLALIDNSTADAFNAKMNYPVYVLNTGVELDVAVKAIEEATSGTTVDTQKLSAYFHTLKDSSGNDVTLLDPTQPKNKLIQVSYTDNTNVDKENKVIESISLNSEALGLGNTSYENVPGKDFVLKCNEQNILSIRLIEFNQVAFDNIEKTLGLNDQKYMIAAGDAGGAAYLMQYPVGYVEGFEYTQTDGTFKSNIAKSTVEVNLKTGKIYNIDASGIPVESNSDDQYIKLSGGAKDTSSFIISGETGVGAADSTDCWNLKFGEKQVAASVPKIVFRDYLELSYAKNVIPGESLVAYGRKFRIDKFSGTVEESMAYYIGKDGKRATGVISPTATEDDSQPTILNTPLYVYDFSDAETLNTGEVKVNKHIPEINMEKAFTPEEETAAIESVKSDLEYDDSKLENLRGIPSQKVICTLKFPSQTLGKTDYSSKAISKPIFYGMATSNSFSKSGLINWLISQNNDDSLRWWISWLSKHSYNYPLSYGTAVDFLKTSYKFELSQAGVIVLDLETINQIQQGYDKEEQLDGSRFMRSTFKILGYILVTYGCMLIAAWTLDTAVDLGFNTLEKISFGKLVAVTDEREVPQTLDEKKKYIGFGGILKSALMVAVLGVVLVFFDVVQLMVMLVDAFAGIAVYIGKFMGGR